MACVSAHILSNTSSVVRQLAWCLLAALTGVATSATASAQQKLHAVGGEGDDVFGRSLGTDGTFALVGAPNDDLPGLLFNCGTARLLNKIGATWSETATLKASDGAGGDGFGTSVFIRGGSAIVGAPFAGAAGAAYIYNQVGSSYQEVAKLVPSTGSTDGFGRSVAIEGDYAFVGVPFADVSGAFNAGSCSVFKRHPTLGWLFEKELTEQPPKAGAEFGTTISISGNWAFVGAPGGGPGLTNDGAVSAYRLTGDVWNLAQVLLPIDTTNVESFGASVQVRGDRAIAGAPESSQSSGKAFVFDLQNGVWTQTQRLMHLESKINERFGQSVSIQSAVALVGAVHTLAGTNGTAFLFERKSGAWVQTSKMNAWDGQAFDEFGWCVALNGSNALISAPGDDDLGSKSGSVYALPFAGELMTTPYCFCENQLAPCGNGNPNGGCTNKTGGGALLLDSGSTSVQPDNLTLTCTNLPTLSISLLIMGGGHSSIPFAAGLLCVGPGQSGLFRFPAQNSGVNGTVVLGPGIVAWTGANFPAAGKIAAGQTWNFQCWYRDPAGPCSASNLSNAVEAKFIP